MAKNNEKYLDLVRLIRKTTKIESTLESAGGTGGGIWEKADSISHRFPPYFMPKIIHIGSIRNDAVHGNLQVKNIDQVLKECDSVLEILEGEEQLNGLKKKVKVHLTALNFFKEENNVSLSKEFLDWYKRLNSLRIKDLKNINELNTILDQKKSRLKELNGLLMKKQLKIIAVGIGALILGYVIMSLIGSTND